MDRNRGRALGLSAILCAVMICGAGAASTHAGTVVGRAYVTARTSAGVADTVYWLPDLEVMAARVPSGADSLVVRGLEKRDATAAPGQLGDSASRRWVGHRRWWLWGAVGAGATAVVYLYSCRRDSPRGTLRVKVGEAP